MIGTSVGTCIFVCKANNISEKLMKVPESADSNLETSIKLKDSVNIFRVLRMCDVTLVTVTRLYCDVSQNAFTPATEDACKVSAIIN